MRPTTFLEYLEQGEVWRDAAGEWRNIADMGPAYRLNCALLPTRRARKIVFGTVIWEHAAGSLAPMTEATEDALDAVTSRMILDPESWIRDSPLHKALTRNLTRSQVDGRVAP